MRHPRVWLCVRSLSCALALGASVCGLPAWAADDEQSAETQSTASTTARRSRSSRTAAGKSAQATEQTIDEKLLNEKLDQILENQEQILKRIDDVMAELQIVKVRATVR